MSESTQARPEPQITPTEIGGATYQLLPPLAADEYARLRADIQARGVLVPVEVDEHGDVIDGHHRVAICRELGITNWPKIERTGLSEADKRRHARQLNLARRHLNGAQKRRLIEQQLRDTPQVSNNKLAAGLGVSDKTVAGVREKLEATSEIPKLARTVGADGRSRPAARQPVPTVRADAERKVTAQKPIRRAIFALEDVVGELPDELSCYSDAEIALLLAAVDDLMNFLGRYREQLQRSRGAA